jgi:hypothetical protein
MTRAHKDINTHMISVKPASVIFRTAVTIPTISNIITNHSRMVGSVLKLFVSPPNIN